MKFYEKRIFWLIVISILIFVGGTLYFYKEHIDIILNFSIPLDNYAYLKFLGVLITLFSGLFSLLYKLDLHDEKEKHLGYIRTINDRIGKKIDGNFFTDINKARKFCNTEEYYILPFGFKYNTSNIDFTELVNKPDFKDEEEKIEKFKRLGVVEILNNEEVLDVKEFIDLDKYIKNLDLHGKNEFNIDSKIVIENFFDKNSITSEALINLFENGKDFVVIEGYYYLYKV